MVHSSDIGASFSSTYGGPPAKLSAIFGIDVGEYWAELRSGGGCGRALAVVKSAPGLGCLCILGTEGISKKPLAALGTADVGEYSPDDLGMS